MEHDTNCQSALRSVLINVIGSTYLYNEQFSIGNQALQSPGNVTDLGIIIDSSLMFNSHIDSIVAKAHLRASLILKCVSLNILLYTDSCI